ncbi:MAG: 1-acyl-sn-glycerol-3-phosphate acyltransferase [Candidatus Aminicenantes bacterium]|nr:1-acyl-sn-glycerol-3-phosphate acyltransferase [Candidatus Aminicenantes bacterium]
MKNYFPKDSYDTPPGTPRYWGDRLLLGSRWGFFVPFIWDIILGSRKQAVKGLYDDEAWVKTCFKVLRYIEKCGGRFHIKGIDNIRKSPDSPLVVVGNHMSSLETAVFPAIIASIRPVTYVVKESLVKQRVFGPIMRSRDPVVVGRKNPREDLVKVLKEGREILQGGRSLIIFPQSTRNVEFDPSKFNTLGVKLAQRAGVKVLPVAIKTDFWGNNKIEAIKDFGPLSRDKPIYMTFGEPMEIKGNGKEEHRRIIDFITSHLKEWDSPIAG